MTKVDTFWFRRAGGDAPGNFGDELGPILLSRITGRDIAWASIAKSQIVTIGSILDGVCKTANKDEFAHGRVLVWGSGLMAPFGARLPKNIDILAVRGKMTIRELSLPDDTLTGDPGILSARYFPKSPRKFRWGVVPHYSHRNSKEIKAAVKATKAKLIDPTDPVEKVLSAISSCDAIISSSLHGLIVADSYGVPCAWLNKKSHGDHTFKFSDYCSGVDRPDFEVVSIETLEQRLAGDPDIAPFSISAELQDRLVQALETAPLGPDEG